MTPWVTAIFQKNAVGPVEPVNEDAIMGPITAPAPLTRRSELLAPIALPGAD